MAWKQLTYDDMRLYLAKDELDKLQTASIDQNLTDVVNQTLDLVADAFRGAWIAKGYKIDSNAHYVCSTYFPFILAYARWVLWNRFPMAQNYALSDARKDEWKLAADLLKNPYIGVDDPDAGSGDEPQDEIAYLSSDAAISIPWLKFPPTFEDGGFPSVYWVNHGGCIK